MEDDNIFSIWNAPPSPLNKKGADACKNIFYPGADIYVHPVAAISYYIRSRWAYSCSGPYHRLLCIVSFLYIFFILSPSDAVSPFFFFVSTGWRVEEEEYLPPSKKSPWYRRASYRRFIIRISRLWRRGKVTSLEIYRSQGKRGEYIGIFLQLLLSLSLCDCCCKTAGVQRSSFSAAERRRRRRRSLYGEE